MGPLVLSGHVIHTGFSLCYRPPLAAHEGDLGGGWGSTFLVLLLPTTNGHLPSTSTRIKSWAAAAADLQHPRKGAQDGDQEWGTLCSGKNWQNRPSDSKIFSGDDFMSPMLASPRIQKSTKILPGDVCSAWLAVTCTRLAETFCKSMCLIACTPPSPKSHICWPPLLPLWSSSQSCLKCCLPGYSPHFAPNKT